MLEFDDLHKRFGDVVALDGCSFSVRRGQLLGFLGPNGAGKTTAMRTIFGLVRPERGRVIWDGSEIDPSARLRFGYMPEQRGLYPRMRILDQLIYFARLHDVDTDEAERSGRTWLERLGLGDRLESRLEDLSHGNQQRVQLAVALVHRPELVVLDEPFNGLDPIAVESMTGVLTELTDRGTAVVFSSHQLDLVEDLCEDVVIIHEGRVVLSGAVSELRAASARRYLDVEVAGGGTAWAEAIPGATVVAASGDRARLLLEDGIDLAELTARASAVGVVNQFSFEPPELSEVFRTAVGR